MAVNPNRLKAQLHKVDLLALAILLLLFADYLLNLTGWLIFDDEGEYLYQVWRMTLGELPYRDFLTPQLPVFLFSGTAVMHLFGPSLLAMRLFTVLLAFSSAALLYAAGRKHAGPLTGLLAMILLLVQADVYKETRIFRNEALFMFLVTLGVVIATWPTITAKHRNLLFAGISFGLATMVKLFGLLPVGGICLWLAWETLRARRPLRDLTRDLLSLLLPFSFTLAAFGLLLYAITPNFLDLILGHHLAQGAKLTVLEVVLDKLNLYWSYLGLYPIFVALALVSAALGFWRGDARQRWSWQLLTAAAFLVLSRDLEQRHFMYLLPSLSLLVAWLLAAGFSDRRRWFGALASGLAFVAILIPWLQTNLDRIGWVDEQTAHVLELIEHYTEPGDTILADDIGLAFYSRRPTTYSGAAISGGAAGSGQITGEILIEEIVSDNALLVIVDESLVTGDHLANLLDYPSFRRFVDRNFEHVGSIRRGFEELSVWARERDRAWRTADKLDIQQRVGTRFGDSMELIGYSLAEDGVKPGEAVDLTLFWRADDAVEGNWKVFAHLYDAGGGLVGQQDKYPYDGIYPTDRWFPGVVVDDRYSIPVPSDLPAGKLHLKIGMYNEVTGERLALRTQDGESIRDDIVDLGQAITVQTN